MEGGARRNSISSELPPPPQNSVQNSLSDQGNDQVELDERSREQEQQQQAMNDGGNAYDREEGENYEEDDRTDGGEIKGDEERPQLAEGFYEVEAIRKKRMRKGEPQYLIKWRGWPEETNTWEPVEHLMSCPDVIEAFEESLRSAKQRSNRKHKRKHSVAPTPQSKKKQKQPSQESSPPATYDIPSVRITIVEEPLSGPSVLNPSIRNETENIGEGTSNNGPTNPSTDAGFLMVSPPIGERSCGNELGSNLSELKVPSSSNQDSMSGFAIHIQENRPIDGVSSADVRPANEVLKVVGPEPVRVTSRIGARRRKSGVVQRFKPEPNSSLRNDANDAQRNTAGGSGVAGVKNMNGLDSNNTGDAPQSISVITKIVKPVNYSSSVLNDTDEVSLYFLARRSDGEEVIVDNKYLKENNPILLINFYEQHLRYNSPCE